MRAKLFSLVVVVVVLAVLATDLTSGAAGGSPLRYLVALGFALLAAAIVTAVGAELLSSSLRDLRVAASAMGTDLRVRSHVRGNDEVGALGESLDHLADNLQQSLDGLASERDRLEAIVETMAEGVVVTDAQDRIVLANGSLRRLVGSTGQLVGKQILEAVRSDELAELVRTARLADAAKSDEFDVRGLSPRRLRVRVAPLAGGRGKGVVAVLSDVTDLRRLESMRRDFVANVSHQLRTPVAAIRAAAETLDGGALEDPSAARDFLGIVLRHAERLHLLVEDLLDLSRIEAHRLDLSPDRLEVDEFLDDVLRLYELSASRHGVKIQVGPCAPDLEMVVDRRALEQVISNLVDNAIKYGGKGTVRLSATRDDEGIAISVRDEGPGIAQQHLPRLFERFYRVDRGRSRDVGGTGLGLSIVKHLTEALGGRVAVDSEVGHGSTFTVHLPEQQPATVPKVLPSTTERELDARISH